MATQGLLSIIDNGTKEVLFKVVCGCNGYNVLKLSDILSTSRKEDFSAATILASAIESGVGCKDCLVVMDRKGSVGVEEELNELYRGTFSDPIFNPRWKRGTADYSEVLYI